MATAVVSIICLALIVLGGMTMSQGILTSVDTAALSVEEISVRDGEIMRTEVARKLSKDFRYMRESFWTEFTIRAFKSGYSLHEVPVTHRERIGGGTRVYNLSKLPEIIASQFLGMFKLWWETK